MSLIDSDTNPGDTARLVAYLAALTDEPRPAPWPQAPHSHRDALPGPPNTRTAPPHEGARTIPPQKMDIETWRVELGGDRIAHRCRRCQRRGVIYREITERHPGTERSGRAVPGRRPLHDGSRSARSCWP